MSEVLEIRTAPLPISGSIRPPGSKSYSNRALPIAAMARGDSVLRGILESEDTQVMAESLRRLGVRIDHDSDELVMRIEGCRGNITASDAHLHLGNSGTSIRFLTALVATGQGTFYLDGIKRMRERPIGDLILALRNHGVDIRSELDNDCPPVIVKGNGLNGGTIRVRGDVSSQFLSGLLIAAPLAQSPLEIVVDGPLVSQPYIDMTLATMQAFGVSCDRDAYHRFGFQTQCYEAADYAIEPDASSASYFFGAAAITGGEITVPGLGTNSLQGDLGLVHVLQRMGCEVEMTPKQTTVRGRDLHGIDIDLCDLSDTVPTLAAVACFADSATHIHNVAHIRRKETDRIAALVTELRKTGLTIEEHEDGLTIHPGEMHAAVFDTYDDHRMAMALSLIGLLVPGIQIRDPGCTAKTYPHFFKDLDSIR